MAMDQARFESMVAKLERDSGASPTLYRFKVAMLAMLGFVVLGVVLGTVGFSLIAIAVVASAAAFSGAGAAVLVLKLGKLLLLAVWPLWHLLKSSVQALFVRLPKPEGHEVTRAQAPALFAALDDLRKRMKGPRFHHVLITHEVNAAVVQRPLFGLIGWPRNYLILGLPLLESLAPQEALAVIAHEYGHLAGSHSRFGAYIYRLRHTWGTIQDLAHRWQGWAGRPLRALIGWYAPYFNAYTFVLARANEYQADAASAGLVGAQVAADALKRARLASSNYGVFLDEVFGAVRLQEQPPADLAARWARVAAEPLVPAQATEWLQEALRELPAAMDTHPALKLRLQALLPQANSLHEVPAPLTGTSAAQAWLGAAVAPVRQRIQSEWSARVAQPWQLRYNELQAKRSRLNDLNALAECSVDQDVERLRLRLQLEPEQDHSADLHDFNQRNPDHPLGLYLEGDHLLDKNDAAGLALLDRVMELDAEAIKPACELAIAFLRKRQETDRVQRYVDRWQERDRKEALRAKEVSDIDVRHDLRSPSDLTPDVLKQAAAIVKTLSRGIKRAQLARRVLPSDPDCPTYVLAIELTMWARVRNRGPSIVQQIARQEWPMHVMICTTHGRYSALRPKLQRLSRSSVVFE